MTPAQEAAHHSERSHVARRIAIAVAAIVALLTTGVGVVASQSPFSRVAVTQRFERALHAKIAIRKYKETYLPPGCIAEGVTITSQDSARNRIARINKLTIEASYPGLLARHVKRTIINGAVIDWGRLHGNDGRFDTVLDEVIANTVVLQAGDARLDFHRVVLRNVGAARPLTYDVSLRTPKLPGELTMRGSLGPWSSGKLDQVPLSGSYTFRNANLGVFQHLAGTLASQGTFAGVISRLDVSGWTDTPDFEANNNGHRHHLKTRFKAVVNGINGDTVLPSIKADLDRTVITGDAAVRQEGDERGKTITLHVTSGRGWVEDLFLLFIKSPQSPIVGAITFEARIAVPPDSRSFTKRVVVDDVFEIGAASFTNPETQHGAESLSEHAEGEPRAIPERISEQLRGHVFLRDGVATFQNAVVTVPGATADLAGTYDLVTKRANLRGKMAMQAELSQATTGFTSFFLKFLNPFYKKKHAGAVVPVSITGTYDHPVFQALTAKKKR
jgi:hypothetical protein